MSVMQTFLDGLEAYGYPVLFVGVLLENAGVPVPGETAVLLAGYLASPAGGSRLHVAGVIAVTLIAAVLGDNLGFWLGREWARPRLQSGRRFLFLTPRTLELAEGYFHRYGLWTIFFARFISGLRVVGALAAGTAGMSWGRFLMANSAGAFAWALAMTLLGYFFGHSWELLHHWLGRGGMVLLGAVAVLVGLPYLLRRLRKLSLGAYLHPAAAQVLQGLLAAAIEITCIALLVMQAQRDHPTLLDREVDTWIAANVSSNMETIFAWFGFLGALPVLILVTVVTLIALFRRQRPWKEPAAMLWALVASELLGLLIVGLLRYHRAEPIKASVWPFGFAGSVPLRAFAVYGMLAWVLSRRWSRARWLLSVASGLIVVLATAGVVFGREQALTEALLELAAGGVVLFTGVWWLEGYGGTITHAPAPPPTAPS